MDDIFIIKPPSAPTIQQKNTMWPTEKIEPKSVEQVNLKHRQLNGEFTDNKQVFCPQYPASLSPPSESLNWYYVKSDWLVRVSLSYLPVPTTDWTSWIWSWQAQQRNNKQLLDPQRTWI